MILVDTSIWVDHLRRGSPPLAARLGAGEVLVHPFVIGEIACGTLRNRALVRLGFATAFAQGGEVPGHAKCLESGRRNYNVIRSLMQAGQAAGELSKEFTDEELAMGYYGVVTTYIMVRMLIPDSPLDRQAGKRIVQLFLEGAHGKVQGSAAAGRHQKKDGKTLESGK